VPYRRRSSTAAISAAKARVVAAGRGEGMGEV